jgi:phospholipase C
MLLRITLQMVQQESGYRIQITILATLSQDRVRAPISPDMNHDCGLQHLTFTGYRAPFYIISPWTRDGNVFTEHADHNSHILFVGT